MEMSRIQSIKTFLKDYKSLDPYLKELIVDSYHHYQMELIQEYLRVHRHPFPNEYIHQS
jgi:hypothetical protein